LAGALAAAKAMQNKASKGWMVRTPILRFIPLRSKSCNALGFRGRKLNFEQIREKRYGF